MLDSGRTLKCPYCQSPSVFAQHDNGIALRIASAAAEETTAFTIIVLFRDAAHHVCFRRNETLWAMNLRTILREAWKLLPASVQEELSLNRLGLRLRQLWWQDDSQGPMGRVPSANTVVSEYVLKYGDVLVCSTVPVPARGPVG